MYPIEEQLWHSHRTVLVLGNVTQVAWWPPCNILIQIGLLGGSPEGCIMLALAGENPINSATLSWATAWSLGR